MNNQVLSIRRILERSAMGFLFILAACLQANDSSSLFSSKINDEEVKIALNDYRLVSVPREIGTLKSVRDLTIGYETSEWTIYPPPDAHLKNTDQPPFYYLPEEICTLTNLESLALDGLKIKELPENFGRLKNLKFLSLAFNKLVLKKEISKLQNLTNLKTLILYGNKVDDNSVLILKEKIPGIDVKYKMEPTYVK
ncbi:MAG TPA: hypothetical protein VEA37_06145 [Flavobacterium sp.]|nr:hypothetical protein [Flavobacterium sp.]